MENATWCGKTIGGGQHKCKWCDTKKEFIKTKKKQTPFNNGTLIWFCPKCDNIIGHIIPKGDV